MLLLFQGGRARTALAVTFEIELAASVWTDKTIDLIRDPLRWNRGIFGSSPTHVLARPGTFSFALDNTTQNAAGTADYYTPGHDDCVAGWKHGTRVRLKLSNGAVARYVFRGRVRTILPDPAISGLRVAACVAHDWLAEFAKTDAIDLPLAEDASEDELIQALIDLVADAPANTDLDTGLDSYLFAFDDLGGGVPKNPQVAQDILQSALAFLYLRGDATDGETVRLENRHARATVDVAYSFETTDIENDPTAIEVPSNLDLVFNDIEVLTVPRRVDAAATAVLISLDAPLEVGPGQTERIFVDYKDPSNEAVYVGGKDMQAPVATTDWTANSASDGSGTDVTSDVDVTAEFFGSRAMIEVANDSAGTAYVRGPGGADGLQVRGRGLYRYREVSSRAVNQDSIDEHGELPLSSPLLMPYQDRRVIGQGLAEYLASLHGGLIRIPRRVRIGSDTGDETLVEQAIARDLGDCIEVPFADEAVRAFIHAGEWELALEGSMAGRLRTVYTLAPADTSDVFVLDDPTLGVLDTGGVLGYA